VAAVQRREVPRQRGSNDPPASAVEAALVAEAQLNPLAFAPLYARYLDPIYRYCFHSLDSREAAEDATSVIFSRALASISACNPASFRSWLFAIAHNTISNAIRDRHQSTSLDHTSLIVDPSPSPEQEAIAFEQQKALRELLVQLPADQRRTVELRLAGLTGPETAAVLGKSHGAVKIAQHRAFVRLRELIGSDAGKGAGNAER
jgi:RNA polymerase sigma-70 factor (ECF subfamily)